MMSIGSVQSTTCRSLLPSKFGVISIWCNQFIEAPPSSTLVLVSKVFKRFLIFLDHVHGGAKQEDKGAIGDVCHRSHAVSLEDNTPVKTLMASSIIRME